jgi:hypothetical protein
VRTRITFWILLEPTSVISNREKLELFLHEMPPSPKSFQDSMKDSQNILGILSIILMFVATNALVVMGTRVITVTIGRPTSNSIRLS